MKPAEPFELAAILARHLDDLGIRYAIGGSVASAYHGEPRATDDLDIVIEAGEVQVRAFASRIASEFYVDAEDAVDAVRNGASFNVIHYATSTKVDVFVADGTAAVRRQFDRRRVIRDTTLFVYAPEDIIVQKLRWYRLGNHVSERQWRDIVGVIRMKRGIDLDDAYLDRAADAFGVRDLLELARQDADN